METRVTEASRPRIQKIAQMAGVSTATVDRVLNNRGGVSKKAVFAVTESLKRLNEQDPVNASEAIYDVILPMNAGLSTEYLAAAFRHLADLRGIRLRYTEVERLNALKLAEELRRCEREGSSGVAFQALEDPLVRETASHLMASGTRLFTVVSDLPGAGLGYIGLDNRAAGRTAGYLMGLLCKGSGTVAVIWGGHLYRAHEERESGARSFLRTEYPNIEIVDVNCTRDDAEEADGRLTALLKKEKGLTGVYCVGAGIIGAVRALERSRPAVPPAVVGHNLTMNTRDFLLRQQMDVIVHQDMTEIAEKALDYLVATPEKRRGLNGEVSIQIITRENLSNQLSLESLHEYLKTSETA